MRGKKALGTEQAILVWWPSGEGVVLVSVVFNPCPFTLNTRREVRTCKSMIPQTHGPNGNTILQTLQVICFLGNNLLRLNSRMASLQYA